MGVLLQVPAVLYVGIWLVDMVIAIAQVVERLGTKVEFEWEEFYQVARYAAIFLVPPYSLIACGAAIEGVRAAPFPLPPHTSTVTRTVVHVL